MRSIGLRVDVDTLRGTRTGVSNLVNLFKRHNIRATFFFSVGPDNMGRHLWRLIRPTFLLKMMRTRATSLYGWDILLKGTLWPGPVIGKRCAIEINNAAKAGHEIGLHAWDHHKWQKTIDKMDQSTVYDEIFKGYNLLKSIIDREPDSFAAPSWKITQKALYALDQFPFRYESDCRGYSLFHPVMNRHSFNHVQVPVTLPTYDEVIGRECTDDTYNGYLLNMIKYDSLNVLTIHAEAEGINCLPLFEAFLDMAQQQEIIFVPLGDFLTGAENTDNAAIKQCVTAGRDGWISCQDGTYPGTRLNSKV
jgi:undecaprenyl phosphate-alpha-L-ara4FN deformylase